MSAANLDLFGNPVRDRKGLRGRPAFEVTPRDTNKVKVLLAVGWSITRIANALSISAATLKRHFRAELREREEMRDRLEAERLVRVAEQAAQGNLGAEKLLGQLVHEQDLKLYDAKVKRAEDRAPAPPAMGKKEARKVAAQSAGHGTDWGDDLVPGVMN